MDRAEAISRHRCGSARQPKTDDPDTEPVNPTLVATRRDPADCRFNVRTALATMVGLGQRSVRPLFSALKINGRRASALGPGHGPDAAGERTCIVRIDAIELISFECTRRGHSSVDCGRGTYIRSDCARSGRSCLHCGGYLTQLRRTRVGPFIVEHEGKNPAELSEPLRSGTTFCKRPSLKSDGFHLSGPKSL